MSELKYKRILLKLSGEALAGTSGFGIDVSEAEAIASRIKEVHEMGVEVAVVIGAGNLWRGKQGLDRGMDRSTADYMGMLATVMNAMALMDALERDGVYTRVSPPSRCAPLPNHIFAVAPSAILKRGVWSSSALGLGTRSFLRILPLHYARWKSMPDVVIKATKVDGVYDSDPKKNPDAKKFERT